MSGDTIVFCTALLAAPTSGLLGVAVGAFFTHRLMRGQAPVPQIPKLRRQRPAEPETPAEPERTYPKLRV